MRRWAGKAARWVVRLILTAISAVLYGLSFTVGLTVRALLIAAAWTVAAVAVGWEDAQGTPEPVRRTDVINATPTSYAPEPPVLRRERMRLR